MTIVKKIMNFIASMALLVPKKSKKIIIINKLFLKKLGSSTRPHSAYVQSAKVEEYN